MVILVSKYIYLNRYFDKIAVEMCTFTSIEMIRLNTSHFEEKSICYGRPRKMSKC